ncbi:hypothetical protein N9059_01955 [bacterium]|nr:hypothetical protein [bacterium]
MLFLFNPTTTPHMLTSDDFVNGLTIREPLGNEKGYWVGCPGFFHDSDTGNAYLTYRIRRPRGVQPDRGGEVKIAKSTDLKNFEDIWTMEKSQVNTASIERSHLVKGKDGNWRYFTSFVDAEDGRWKTTVIKTDAPENLDVANMKDVFKAGDLNLEGVKDPWILEVDGVYHMFLSVAQSVESTDAESHDSLDIYNTGQCVSSTGLATSTDLDNWEWQGIVLAPEADGWDKYCRRINSVIPRDGKYYAFYDGSASHLENYEERNGVAVSDDLRNWTCLTPAGPNITSPNASGSLRYCDVQNVNGEIFFFYEWARADEAHEMRLIRTNADQLPIPA